MACFVDFQKAYDTIWRNGLFDKLMKYKLSQRIVFLLKSMYDRVASAVKVKSGLTATFTPLVGVRQGCKLIVNDIVDIFDSVIPRSWENAKSVIYYMQMIFSCFPNQNIVCRALISWIVTLRNGKWGQIYRRQKLLFSIKVVKYLEVNSR